VFNDEHTVVFSNSDLEPINATNDAFSPWAQPDQVFNSTVVESPNAIYSSGIREEGDNITFTFPNVGSFPMQCTAGWVLVYSGYVLLYKLFFYAWLTYAGVLHQPMVGNITVVANQSAQQVTSPAQVTALGTQEFNQALAMLPSLEQQILANASTGQVNVEGRQAFRVMVGGGNGSVRKTFFALHFRKLTI